MIAKNYVSQYNFYVDVISTIPISEISYLFSGTSVSNTYARIFKQFKLFRVLRLAKLTKFFNSEQLKTLFKLLQLFFGFLIIVLQ